MGIKLREDKKKLEEKKKKDEFNKKKAKLEAELKKKLMEKKIKEKKKNQKECQNKIYDILDKSLKLKDDDLVDLPIEVKISEATNLKNAECKDIPKLQSKIDEKIKQIKNKRDGVIKLKKQKKELEEKKKL